MEHAAQLVADEKNLRAAAAVLGLRVGGSLSLLAMAVRRGLMSGAEAVRVVERMVDRGWYCSPLLLRSFTVMMLAEDDR